MSRVYAVQQPSRRVDGEWVPTMDLSAAERFGELTFCLPPGNVSRDFDATHATLSGVLADYDLGADYVLLLGDPVAIAQVVHILSTRATWSREAGGPWQIEALKWDRRSETYLPYRVG
jgi:hypothetical protein